MVLAEAITLDGGVVAAILAVMLLAFVLFVTGLTLSIKLAKRAGRDHTRKALRSPVVGGRQTGSALIGFYVLLALEFFFMVGSISGIFGIFDFGIYVIPAVVGIQLLIFYRSAKSAGREAPPATAPPDVELPASSEEG